MFVCRSTLGKHHRRLAGCRRPIRNKTKWRLLFVFNRLKVKKLVFYIVPGIVMWYCFLQSGVHATIAGVVLGLIIPLKGHNEKDLQPLSYLEDKLHPWVAFFVMPLFAFANSGVSFQGLTWHILLDPVALGVIAGLVVGNQLGVFSFFLVRDSSC